MPQGCRIHVPHKRAGKTGHLHKQRDWWTCACTRARARASMLPLPRLALHLMSSHRTDRSVPHRTPPTPPPSTATSAPYHTLLHLTAPYRTLPYLTVPYKVCHLSACHRRAHSGDFIDTNADEYAWTYFAHETGTPRHAHAHAHARTAHEHARAHIARIARMHRTHRTHRMKTGLSRWFPSFKWENLMSDPNWNARHARTHACVHTCTRMCAQARLRRVSRGTRHALHTHGCVYDGCCVVLPALRKMTAFSCNGGEAVQKSFSVSLRHDLAQCWRSVGAVLAQCWCSVGAVLAQCWRVGVLLGGRGGVWRGVAYADRGRGTRRGWGR